jgi:hypothetical protein
VQSTTRNPLNRIPLGRSSSMTSRSRMWIVYYKSEENLDHLLQVGGGFGSSTSSRRRTSQHLSNGSRPCRLLGLHQQCHTFTKWPSRPDGASILVGRSRASEGHKSSKLPSSAHPFFACILVGHESSKLPGSAHLFAFQSW